MVREAGLEPARLAAQEPKSWASANSATLALIAFDEKLLKMKKPRAVKDQGFQELGTRERT